MKKSKEDNVMSVIEYGKENPDVIISSGILLGFLSIGIIVVGIYLRSVQEKENKNEN